jgi:hypothetical protein
VSIATLAELKVWLTSNGDLDTADDAGLQATLDATDRQIERWCGRRFTVETAVTKTFYPKSASEVEVTDLISLTSIASDAHGDRTFTTTFAPGEYELLPYLDAMGALATRYQLVRTWPTTSKSFTPGRLVRIIGNFGYVEASGEAPPDVKQAELVQAARLWKRRETPLGVLSNTDLGTFERLSKADPDVQALLAPYSRTTTWVLV